MIISAVSLLIAAIFASGIWLLFSRQWLGTIIGLLMLSHAINLLILNSGSMNDPLPQALILTAIVIGLATQTVLLVLAYFAKRYQNVSDLNSLKEKE
ncbi:sodium:proton antiporter [Bdellovibrio sp. HCB290]|uniref:sodium:proton antiporter n=1 Tax=Bdellovibrio sp. HCB290 TaxID=3394356 RepID=UPI0039B536E8